MPIPKSKSFCWNLGIDNNIDFGLWSWIPSLIYIANLAHHILTLVFPNAHCCIIHKSQVTGLNRKFSKFIQLPKFFYTMQAITSLVLYMENPYAHKVVVNFRCTNIAYYWQILGLHRLHVVGDLFSSVEIAAMAKNSAVEFAFLMNWWLDRGDKVVMWRFRV